MLFKFLTLGVIAVTLVGAAPSESLQTPMTPCEIAGDTDTSVGTGNFSGPGLYEISNFGTKGRLLPTYLLPVHTLFATNDTRVSGGAFAVWRVSRVRGSDAYRIYNLALKNVTYVDSDGLLISGTPQSGENDLFTIVPGPTNKNDTFIIGEYNMRQIGEYNTTRVWSATGTNWFSTPVKVIRQFGLNQQLWKFTPIGI